MKDNLLLIALKGEVILIALGSKQAYPLLWRRTYLYLSKLLSTQIFLKRLFRTKGSQCLPLLRRHAEM